MVGRRRRRKWRNPRIPTHPHGEGPLGLRSDLPRRSRLRRGRLEDDDAGELGSGRPILAAGVGMWLGGVAIRTAAVFFFFFGSVVPRWCR